MGWTSSTVSSSSLSEPNPNRFDSRRGTECTRGAEITSPMEVHISVQFLTRAGRLPGVSKLRRRRQHGSTKHRTFGLLGGVVCSMLSRPCLHIAAKSPLENYLRVNMSQYNPETTALDKPARPPVTCPVLPITHTIYIGLAIGFLYMMQKLCHCRNMPSKLGKQVQHQSRACKCFWAWVGWSAAISVQLVT